MTKALPLISEALKRFPDDHEQQVAFVAGAIGKLIELRFGQYPCFNEDSHVMLVDLLDALQLPEGPLQIPGESMPLFETSEELNEYIQSNIPVWTKELREVHPS